MNVRILAASLDDPSQQIARLGRMFLAVCTVAVVLAALGLARPASAAPAVEDFRLANVACERFVKWRMNSPYGYRLAVGFATGYLQAAGDFGKIFRVPVREAEGYLFEYCYSNPRDSLMQALQTLIEPNLIARR